MNCGRRGVGDQGDFAFAEVIIVQAEDAAVGSEAEFVRAHGPGEIVVDEKARGAAALHPGIVQPAERGERCIRAAAFEHDRKRRQCFLEDPPARTGFHTRRTPD